MKCNSNTFNYGTDLLWKSWTGRTLETTLDTESTDDSLDVNNDLIHSRKPENIIHRQSIVLFGNIRSSIINDVTLGNASCVCHNA